MNFQPFLDLAVPEVYDRNAFRLLELSVESTDRDLSKRREWMEKATRNKLAVPTGPARVFPREPAPNDHEVREAAHAVQDAERRLVQEFLWFWPMELGRANIDPALRLLAQNNADEAVNIWRQAVNSHAENVAAKHNLAIYFHFLALDQEKLLFADRPKSENVIQLTSEEMQLGKEAEQHWKAAMHYWESFANEEASWSRVSERIRAMNDNSLTTGASRKIKETLPVALTLIQARLAIRSLNVGLREYAQRHVERINKATFNKERIEDGLRIAAEPTRTHIKSLCEATKKEIDVSPEKGDEIAERLLLQSAKSLAVLDFLLAEGNAARVAEHDQVATTAISCAVAFGNKTQNWKKSKTILSQLLDLAESTAAKEKIRVNLKTLEGNIELNQCWFCGDNDADEKCKIEVPMHGNVQKIPIYNGMRTTWSHGVVSVPRCRNCQDWANRKAITWVASLLALIGGAIVAGNAYNSDTGTVEQWGQLVFGLSIPLVVIPVFLKFCCGRNFKPHKQRSRDEFPGIIARKSQGWKFGKSPTG